jgi:hypothetical protein
VRRQNIAAVAWQKDYAIGIARIKTQASRTKVKVVCCSRRQAARDGPASRVIQAEKLPVADTSTLQKYRLYTSNPADSPTKNPTRFVDAELAFKAVRIYSGVSPIAQNSNPPGCETQYASAQWICLGTLKGS